MRERAAAGSAVVGQPRRPPREGGLIRALLAIDSRAAAYAAALGAAIVLIVAIPLGSALNIWIDEAFARHSTGAGIAYAWREAIDFEAQPPLYFIIEAAWRTLNEGSIGFARFPSAFFTAAGVAIIVGAAHRLTPRIPPLAVALITAGNPLVIWAATEMRVYALVFLVGSILTWTLYTGFLVPVRSRRAQVVYVIAAIAGLYTQYYVGFFLFAHAVTLLAVGRRAVRSFAASMAIVALAFAPFAGIAIQQVRGSGGFIMHASFLKVTHEVLVTAFVYALPHDVSWSATAKLVGLGVALLLVALVALGRPIVRDAAARALILQWIVCLAIYIVLFFVAGLPYSLRRHIIAVAPSSLLIPMLLVASLTRRKALIGSAVIATFAICSATTLWVQFRPPLMKTGDWQRVAQMLIAQPAAPVAVFPAEFALALGTYLTRPLIVIPRPMDFTYDYIHTTALKNEAEVATVLDPVRARSDRLWLVMGDVCLPGGSGMFDYRCRYLERYLTRRYRIVKTVAFRGSVARLYSRLPDIRAKAPAAHVSR